MTKRSCYPLSFSWWHEAALVLLIAVLLGGAWFVMPSFLQVKSQLLLTRQLWEFAILALGMTLIIITGGIDLSIGSAMGLCAVAFGLTYEASRSVAVSCLACLLTGTAAGAINGVLISR